METPVYDAQGQLVAALLRGDVHTLEALVAPDCRIIGPKGFVSSRDEWIGVHQERTYTQVKLENIETDARTYGDAAIRWDVQQSVCLHQGQTIEGQFHVTGVWIRTDGRWQLVCLQYTAVPS